MAVRAEHVKALVKRHIEGDNEGFYSVALQLAANAARGGQTKFAQDVRDLVEFANTPKAASQLRPIPIAQPRGELAGLMSVSYPDVRLSQMVLSVEVARSLERVVLEQGQRDWLEDHGLMPVYRLLHLGPPGTGKSMSAQALARELSLPMFTIQLDGLISKFMGETATKLRLVFDAIATTRAVYLFDEFDAIGGKRAGGNDVGEARRMLNSFLQFLEHASSSSLIVAATNHPEILDEALFRRFDLVIGFGLPDTQASEAVLRNRLSLLDTSEVDWGAATQGTEGFSHAELVRSAESAAKQVLLRGETSLTTSDLRSAFGERPLRFDD